MILSMLLHNFKGYEDDKKVDFSNGFELITKKAGQLKTLLSAIYWVAFNCPLNNEMVNNPNDTTTIQIRIRRGETIYTINRRKGAGIDDYIVYKLDGDDRVVYTGFGSRIPLEITNLLNFNFNLVQQEIIVRRIAAFRIVEEQQYVREGD